MSTFSCWLQRRLLEAGHNPGPIDCDPGRLTYAALRGFQRAQGLRETGVADADTVAALRATGNGLVEHPAAPPIPWYDEARRLQGTREVPGRRSNPVIIDWATGLGSSGNVLPIDYDDDDIPWCGLFVGHCVGSTLPVERLPRNILGARNWLSFGVQTAPRLGAVLVFWRGSPSGWQGHVGFYDGEDANAWHVLGGNQSNAVNVTRIAKNRLLGARWPATADTLQTATRHVTADGRPISTDEA